MDNHPEVNTKSLAKVYVPVVGIIDKNAPPIVVPDFIVCEDLPANASAPGKRTDTPEKSTDPNMYEVLENDISGLPEAALQSMFLQTRTESTVITLPAENVAFITTSSCGKGILVVQPTKVVHVKLPRFPVIVCVSGLVKTMPLLPPQSPEKQVTPDMSQSDPTPAISLKLTFSTETEVAEIS